MNNIPTKDCPVCLDDPVARKYCSGDCHGTGKVPAEATSPLQVQNPSLQDGLPVTDSARPEMVALNP